MQVLTLPTGPAAAGSATATPIPRVFQPRRTVPTDVVRPTRAEVSLPNLRFNLRQLSRRTAADVWCVLKADGYGHGAKACARTLERAGAKGLCVALLEEGIELRNAGIQVPILVMGGYCGSAESELLAHHLTPVVYDAGQVERLGAEARYRGAKVNVHLKVDTGMGRLGFSPHEAEAICAAMLKYPELCAEGLMTHFSSAGSDQAEVERQLDVFDEVTVLLAQRGVRARARHAANTAALLTCKRSHLDIVRPGIGVFGLAPDVELVSPGLRPTLRVLSTVVALRDLQPGQSVGYGARWKAERASRVATIPIGYADGLSRGSARGGHVLVRGKRAPIIGAISMDLTTIDVTELEGISIGDEAVVVGEQLGTLGSDCITVEEIAQREGTIAWEVMTSVSSRVPRFYRGA